MRYLGHLRQQIEPEWWKKLLLSLAIARNYKAYIRTKLRVTLRSSHTSDYACKVLVANTINAVLMRLHDLGIHRAGETS